MHVSCVAVFISLISGFCFVHASNEDLCVDKGFHPDTLKCTTCETLKSVVGDDELVNDCLGCCSQADADVYELAVLEIDERLLTRYSHWKVIISDAKKRSSNLIMRSKEGSWPKLLMYKDRTDVDPFDSVNVASWSAEDAEEYLKIHLVGYGV